MGDITGSGAFNIAQLVAAAQILAGWEATSLQKLAGDLTGNGAIDIADLVVLAGYVRDAKKPEPAAPYPDAPQEGRTLVVYFSATGSTRRAAELIAEATDADLFEIEPAEPYTAADLNYNDPESRVSREHQDPALRNVPLANDSVPGWEEYDRVFIGYPIWWGMAAWPVSSFVAANSFDGKDCWCFCTSASSGVGSSADQLAQAASGGSWLGSHRFSSNPDPSEVDAWLDSIDAAA
ncbi:MAG: flavodoxin [Clostridia bacterium]|nr:flavodoxin [Clostridia bacterium]